MAVVLALVVLALIVGIGGIIQGLFWLISVGFILLLIGIALLISRTRSTR